MRNICELDFWEMSTMERAGWSGGFPVLLQSVCVCRQKSFFLIFVLVSSTNAELSKVVEEL